MSYPTSMVPLMKSHVILWGLAVAAFLVGMLSGYLTAGMFFAFILGLAALVMTMVNTGKVRCPHCRSRVSRRATACPKCGRDVAAPVTA